MQKKELVAAPLVLSSSRSPTPYLTPNSLMIKINYIDALAPQWPSDNLLQLQMEGLQTQARDHLQLLYIQIHFIAMACWSQLRNGGF